MKSLKMRENEDVSRIFSQVGTTQEIMNTTYLDIKALSITPPSPLADCCWQEDWLKDSSIAQVKLRELFIILNLYSWAFQHYKLEPQPLQLKVSFIAFAFLKK